MGNRMSEAKIDEFPCIFPASREFPGFPRRVRSRLPPPAESLQTFGSSWDWEPARLRLGLDRCAVIRDRQHGSSARIDHEGATELRVLLSDDAQRLAIQFLRRLGIPLPQEQLAFVPM